MTIGATIAVIWIAFTVATCVALIPVVIWGVKTRQFAKQDHVRFLPLECSVPLIAGGKGEKGIGEKGEGRSGGDASA